MRFAQQQHHRNTTMLFFQFCCIRIAFVRAADNGYRLSQTLLHVREINVKACTTNNHDAQFILPTWGLKPSPANKRTGLAHTVNGVYR